MGNQPNTSAWFGKCGLSATLILVACGIAAARFGHALQLPATTSRDGALVTLNRYVDNPIPDIVLTGSSMTFRLKEEYFETPRLRNLALAGGSVVTGLQIVAGQRQIPKMVVVEINVLSRPPDQNLVERYSADHGRDGPFLRPIRTAIAAYENWIHAPVSHAEVKASLEAPNFLLKIIPHVDGTPRICELVEYHLEHVLLKGAWTGPAALSLNPHALAPVAELPVLEVVSAIHIVSDLTLGLGEVVHDYLQEPGRHPLHRRESSLVF